MESDPTELSQKLRQWKARKEELESFKAKKLASKPKWGANSRGSPEKTLPFTPSSHKFNRLSLSSSASVASSSSSSSISSSNSTPQKSCSTKTPSITPSRISAAHPQNYYNLQLEAAQNFITAGELANAEGVYQLLWASPYAEQAAHDLTFWDGWFQASTGSVYPSASPTPIRKRASLSEPKTPLRTPLAPIAPSASSVNSRKSLTSSKHAMNGDVKQSSKTLPSTESEAMSAFKASFFSPRKNLAVVTKYRAPTLGTPRTMAAKRAELLGLASTPAMRQKTFGSHTPVADRLRRELEKIDENENKKCEEAIQAIRTKSLETVQDSPSEPRLQAEFDVQPQPRPPLQVRLQSLVQLFSQQKPQQVLLQQRSQPQTCVLPDGVLIVGQTPEKTATVLSITPKAMKSLEFEEENDENIPPTTAVHMPNPSIMKALREPETKQLSHKVSSSLSCKSDSITSSERHVLAPISTKSSSETNNHNQESPVSSNTNEIKDNCSLQTPRLLRTGLECDESSTNDKSSSSNDDSTDINHNDSRSRIGRAPILRMTALHTPATLATLDETYTCIRYLDTSSEMTPTPLSPEQENISNMPLLSPLKEEVSLDEKCNNEQGDVYSPLYLSQLPSSTTTPLPLPTPLLASSLPTPPLVASMLPLTSSPTKTEKKLSKRKSVLPPSSSPVYTPELSFDLPSSVETRQDASIIHTLFMPTFHLTEEELSGQIALEAVRVKSLRKSTQNELSSFNSSSDMILSPVRRSARRKSVQTPEEINKLLEKTNYMYSPNPDLQPKTSTAKRSRTAPRLETVKEESKFLSASDNLCELVSLDDSSKAQTEELSTRRSTRVSSRLSTPSEPPRPSQSYRRVDTPRPPKMQPRASSLRARTR